MSSFAAFLLILIFGIALMTAILLGLGVVHLVLAAVSYGRYLWRKYHAEKKNGSRR